MIALSVLKECQAEESQKQLSIILYARTRNYMFKFLMMDIIKMFPKLEQFYCGSKDSEVMGSSLLNNHLLKRFDLDYCTVQGNRFSGRSVPSNSMILFFYLSKLLLSAFDLKSPLLLCSSHSFQHKRWSEVLAGKKPNTREHHWLNYFPQGTDWSLFLSSLSNQWQTSVAAF